MPAKLESTEPVTEIEMLAKIIRADGTVEDLGRIAYYHKNPILRFWRNLITVR